MLNRVYRVHGRFTIKLQILSVTRWSESKTNNQTDTNHEGFWVITGIAKMLDSLGYKGLQNLDNLQDSLRNHTCNYH